MPLYGEEGAGELAVGRRDTRRRQKDQGLYSIAVQLDHYLYFRFHKIFSRCFSESDNRITRIERPAGGSWRASITSMYSTSAAGASL
jgi:hypothetical protein